MHFATLTGNFRSKDIEESNMTTTTDKPSSVVDKTTLMLNNCLPEAFIGTMTYWKLVKALKDETKAAYSKGANDMLEKVKEYIYNNTFSFKGREELFIDAGKIAHHINKLLSQYKQGVEVEK